MSKLIVSEIPGLSYKEHETRIYGRKKDRYYVLRYQRNKKQVTEYLGWTSDGWTLNDAKKILFRIKKNIKLGLHPQSLKEIREENEHKYEKTV